jgi:hypothetical protein
MATEGGRPQRPNTGQRDAPPARSTGARPRVGGLTLGRRLRARPGAACGRSVALPGVGPLRAPAFRRHCTPVLSALRGQARLRRRRARWGGLRPLRPIVPPRVLTLCQGGRAIPLARTLTLRRGALAHDLTVLLAPLALRRRGLPVVLPLTGCGLPVVLQGARGAVARSGSGCIWRCDGIGRIPPAVARCAPVVIVKKLGDDEAGAKAYDPADEGGGRRVACARRSGCWVHQDDGWLRRSSQVVVAELATLPRPARLAAWRWRKVAAFRLGLGARRALPAKAVRPGPLPVQRPSHARKPSRHHWAVTGRQSPARQFGRHPGSGTRSCAEHARPEAARSAANQSSRCRAMPLVGATTVPPREVRKGSGMHPGRYPGHLAARRHRAGAIGRVARATAAPGVAPLVLPWARRPQVATTPAAP